MSMSKQIASCDPPKISTGCITAAMAWRVKYRKEGPNGKALRIAVPIHCLGAHQKNRGGVYPAGIRCKNLCSDLGRKGFAKEEANHMGVAVEDIPFEELKALPPMDDYESKRRAPLWPFCRWFC